jgi:hypothetical protein
VVKPLDPGELQMARWLEERGYSFEFEPSDWGVSTCPDFRVTVDGQVVAIEVESIESTGGFKSHPAGVAFSRGLDKALRPVRAKIKYGARQLKPLAYRDMPLIVAVANPYHRPVPFSADMMIAAMYGDPSYSFDSDGSARNTLDRNGKLTNDHPYVSAVILLRQAPGVRKAASEWFDANRHRFSTSEDIAAEVRKLTEAGYFGDEQAVAIDLIETISDGPRVPPRFASGPQDTHWVPLADKSGITKVP